MRRLQEPRAKRRFTAEFKREAVRLLKVHRADGITVARSAREVGVSPDLLRTWERQVDAADESAPPATVFPGTGRATGERADLRRLQAENERLRQENAFLKKAAAYFASECPTPRSAPS